MKSSALRSVIRQAEPGLYVHFPYCIHKCSYCDFYSAGMDRQLGGTKTVPLTQLESFHRALETEFRARRPAFADARSVNSVFFGGGTASLLPADSVARILSLFSDEFDLSGAEITVEGNPENFRPDYIEALRQAGVNRIHVGVQSLREKTLRQLDRYFDPQRYAALIDTLAHSSIENRGVDLMYGVPGQSEEEFLADLERLLDCGVTHASLYSLTAEQGTPYEAAVRRKQERPPNEEMQAALFQDLPRLMARRGFLNYEVSNFAQPGFVCRHNMRYWLYERTLALGPGAHGFDGQLRYGNPRNISAWENSPAAAPLSPHEPSLEIPLCILRILLPIPRETLQELLSPLPRSAAAFDLLQRWADEGLARLDDEFQWNAPAVLYLDDRIMEMQDVLTAA